MGHQIATFDPLGLRGRAYWYSVYPLHQLVFNGMLRGIAAAQAPGADACRDRGEHLKPATPEPARLAAFAPGEFRLIGPRSPDP